MNRIHTGVRAYAFRIHIPSLSPVPVRVKERSALADAVQTIGMCYLMDVERQVVDRVTAVIRRLVPSGVRMLACRQILYHTAEFTWSKLTAIVNKLITRKEQALPMQRIARTDRTLLINIVYWSDYQMERVNRVTTAPFAGRASSGLTTVVIEEITRLVGRNNNVRVLCPNERIVLTYNRILYREMVRRFHQQVQIERRIAVMFRVIVPLVI